MLTFLFFRTSTTREEKEEELPCGLVCRMLNFLGVGTNAYKVKKEEKKNSLKSYCQ
jgi:hypothetical protein